MKIGKRKFELEKATIDSQTFLMNSKKKQMPATKSPVKYCPSLIWKLHVDCLFNVFDYLCLDDLVAIGHTCKRMQYLAGEFVHENYRAKRKTCQDGSIYMDWPPRSVNIFTEFLEKLYISGNLSNGSNFMTTNCTKFLREIRLSQMDLSNCKMECIEEILNSVEIVEIEKCTLKYDFYTNFLQFCTKLKRLSVSRSSYDRDHGLVIGSTNEWLCRKYPTLEHLELTDLYEFKQNELITFFTLNPNVRTFSTDVKSLLSNRDSLITSNIRINQLAVEFHPQIINSEIQSTAIVDFLRKQLENLYKREFFQILHLFLTFLDHENCAQELFTLESLTMVGGYIRSIEHPLLRVTELNIIEGSSIMNLDALPDYVPNLERIHFSDASSDHILPFIRNSPKLKIMKIENLLDGMYLLNGDLNIEALNTERMKRNNVRKLIIYVNERVFLATKWKHLKMNFNRIRIKRGESFNWEGLNSNIKFVRSF